MVNTVMFAMVYIIVGFMIGTVAAVFIKKEQQEEKEQEKKQEEKTCSNCRRIIIPLHKHPCNTCCRSGTDNWEREYHG